MQQHSQQNTKEQDWSVKRARKDGEMVATVAWLTSRYVRTLTSVDTGDIDGQKAD